MSKDVFTLAKLLGARNISESPLATSPLGRGYLNQREYTQNAEQNLQSTRTPLGALSGGIALYVQRKRENEALEQLNKQMEADNQARLAKRQAIVGLLPEDKRPIADIIENDQDLAKYASDILTPPSQREQLALENAQLQNQKLKRDINKAEVSYDVNGNEISAKPVKLPVQALKMQNEGLDVIGTAGGINADLGVVEKQLEDKKLKLGPVENLKSQALNAAGRSTPESRNYASFLATLEKQRNDSLRLNKGVQTDKDAERAWNELFNNLSDPEVVKQRLQEIQKINKRGADLQKLQVDQIRANYGAPPLNYSQFEQRPSGLGNESTSSGNEFTSSSGVKFTIKR